MSQVIAIPDHCLIPYCAEGILARRWFDLCVNEGHIEAPVAPNAPKPAPQDAIIVNKERGRKTRLKVLKALQEGHNTIPALVANTGLSDTNTRTVMSRLTALGRVRKRERVVVNGRWMWAWEVVSI